MTFMTFMIDFAITIFFQGRAIFAWVLRVNNLISSQNWEGENAGLRCIHHSCWHLCLPQQVRMLLIHNTSSALWTALRDRLPFPGSQCQKDAKTSVFPLPLTHCMLINETCLFPAPEEAEMNWAHNCLVFAFHNFFWYLVLIHWLGGLILALEPSQEHKAGPGRAAAALLCGDGTSVSPCLAHKPPQTGGAGPPQHFQPIFVVSLEFEQFLTSFNPHLSKWEILNQIHSYPRASQGTNCSLVNLGNSMFRTWSRSQQWLNPSKKKVYFMSFLVLSNDNYFCQHFLMTGTLSDTKGEKFQLYGSLAKSNEELQVRTTGHLFL